ncbi:FecR domain-containing protein [uncultured Sunxiuqinia sp.]|uniref:FecR family protein n=1 Tax=uncultured Sunxiuqinia sp. TaxID=1573825 RepID=UPI002AA5E7B1|nr:FecR domain-containing protein [uncultured Sunxiuqinia sp.]
MSDYNKYVGYSVEELLNDQGFVLEVKKRNEKSWNEFLSINSRSKENMIEAKRLIQLFDVEETGLDQNRKYLLWNNISQFNKVEHKKKEQFVIPLFMRIAAVVVLLLAIASVWYLNSNRQQEWIFEAGELNGKPAVKQSTLVLSNGDQFALKVKESTITVLREKNAIQIEQDSIVSVNERKSEANVTEAMNEVIVPYGEKTNLVLADGTKVWLNAGSRLAFPMQFSKKNRKVYLEGEGYFEVTENESHSFIVVTRDVSVKVYGTKFNISAYLNDTYSETVLLEGSVSVENTQSLFSKEVKMIPGQKITYSKESKSISLEEIKNPELYVTWREGWYQFSNVDLTYVIHKLERFYNVQFEYGENIVQESYHVSGKLDLKESLEQVLSVIAKVAKVDCQITENRIKLKKQQ